MEYGIEVIVVPLERENGEDHSSTLLRKALRDGEVETANRLLGHPYTLIAPVVHGRGLAGSGTIPPPTSISRMSRSFPRTGSMPP